MTPSHLQTVESAKPRRTFLTPEAFHGTVESFYDTFAPSMTPPGGRFEYLTSSRDTNRARMKPQNLARTHLGEHVAEANAEARARKVPKAAKCLLRKISTAG